MEKAVGIHTPSCWSSCRRLAGITTPLPQSTCCRFSLKGTGVNFFTCVSLKHPSKTRSFLQFTPWCQGGIPVPQITLNFLFQMENIQHVRHLPDIFHLQNALIHFFQNSYEGEEYTVHQFLDQPGLSGAIQNSTVLWMWVSDTLQHPDTLLRSCCCSLCDEANPREAHKAGGATA